MSNIPLKEKLNPINWVAYVTGYILSWMLPMHFVEQLIYRTNISDCRKCAQAGECKFGDKPCYCAMPAKAYVPFKSCSNGHWGPLVWRASKWEVYKKQFGVSIIVNETNPSGV